MFDPGREILPSQCSPTLRARVAAKIRVDPVTGCHVWTGAVSKKRRSYRPVIQLGGRGTRVVLVARLVLEWQDGPPPTPLHEAGHTCPHGENELCVNEEHLTWQTRTENENSKRPPSALQTLTASPTSSTI